ncbi:Gfo/Idh/MocA family protein [Aliihoeflea sp. PC F10.4]
MEYLREAKRRIRIGIVGAGSHSYRNIFPTLTYLPVDLVAVADIDLDRASATAKQYGATESYGSAEEMYSKADIEAVILCVSPQMHPALTIAAFKAGLHVFMEKPAAMVASEVEEMVAARGDRVSVVGYKKAFMPALRKAQEILAMDGVGPLRSVVGTYPMSIPENGRKVLDEREATNWLANGCHPLSVFLEFGGPAAAVTTHRGKNGGGALIIHHANGTIGNFHLAQGAPMFQPFERYVIYADKQSIEIENSRRLSYQRGIEFSYATGTSFAPPGLSGGAIVWEAQDGLNTLENKAVFTQGLYGELAHFFESILASQPATIGTLEFALDLTRVYEAALLSEGDTVEISQGM